MSDFGVHLSHINTRQQIHYATNTYILQKFHKQDDRSSEILWRENTLLPPGFKLTTVQLMSSCQGITFLAEIFLPLLVAITLGYLPEAAQNNLCSHNQHYPETLHPIE